MSDYWEENVEDGQLQDVSFPIARRAIAGGHDFARIRRPNRDGQETERTGRKPIVFKLEVPLFRGVDEAHYPDRYLELVDVLTADDPPLEYIDPILGSFRVEVADWDAEADAERRDGENMTFTLEEVTTSDFSAIVTARSPGSAAIAWAADLDGELDEAGVDDATVREAFTSAGAPVGKQETLRPGLVFTDIATAFGQGLTLGASVASEVERSVDQVRARVLAITRLTQLGTSSGFAVRGPAFLMLESIVAQGERAVASSVPIVERVLSEASGARELATRLYGSADRADEIVRRNNSRRPWALPPDTRVRVAVR